MRNTFAAGFIRAISEILGKMKARCPVAALERSASVVPAAASKATLSLRSTAATPIQEPPLAKKMYAASIDARVVIVSTQTPFCASWWPTCLDRMVFKPQTSCHEKAQKGAAVRAEICVASIDAVGTGPAA
jgi:hypothetical protein